MIETDISGWKIGVPYKFVNSAPNEPEDKLAYEYAKKLFPNGWTAVKPYLRKVADPLRKLLCKGIFRTYSSNNKSRVIILLLFFKIVFYSISNTRNVKINN